MAEDTFDFPDDLIEAQRAFLAAEALWAAAAKSDDPEGLQQAYQATQSAAGALSGHPWWEGKDRAAARMALRRKAREAQ